MDNEKPKPMNVSYSALQHDIMTNKYIDKATKLVCYLAMELQFEHDMDDDLMDIITRVDRIKSFIELHGQIINGDHYGNINFNGMFKT